MKKALIYTALLLAAILVVGYIANTTRTAQQPRDVEANAPTLAGTVTTLEQSSIPSVTPENTNVYIPVVKRELEEPFVLEALTPTLNPTPAFEPTATTDPFAPTIDPMLLERVEVKQVTAASAEMLRFNKTLYYIVVESGLYSEEATFTGSVMDMGMEDIPFLEGLAAPCTPGTTPSITGYTFHSLRKYGEHRGLDMYCGDDLVAAAAKGKVYMTGWIDETNAKYLSSGFNVYTISTIPPGTTYKDAPMGGWLLFGNGHMETNIQVEVGQKVEAGQVLGEIGNTVGSIGSSTGQHNHYHIIWIKLDGTYEFLDPEEWGAMVQRG